MPKIGIVTQARMTSTRLPGKVLLRAGGKTLLQHHIERVSRADVPFCVATTVNDTDEPIVAECLRLGVPFYRGSERDVLSRFVGAVNQQHYDHVVRVTSDCPLIDGAMIKTGIQRYLDRQDDNLYFSNCLERTYPRGMDFEVFSRALLLRSDRETYLDSQREHVTKYLYTDLKDKINFEHFKSDGDNSDLRLTVDENDDFVLIKTLIEDFHSANLSVDEIVRIIRSNKRLAEINSHIRQK